MAGIVTLAPRKQRAHAGTQLTFTDHIASLSMTLGELKARIWSEAQQATRSELELAIITAERADRYSNGALLVIVAPDFLADLMLMHQKESDPCQTLTLS